MTLNDELKKSENRKALAEARYYEHMARGAKVKADEAEREQALIAATEYENRIYTFDGAVRSASVQHAIAELGLWVRRDPSKPIKVIFNSPGGGVFDGMALYDYIQQIRQETRVDTVALGMAASMGGVLLQAGETRTMSKHSYLLIHEVSGGSIGKTSEMEDELRFSKKLQDRLLEILAERSTLTKQQIARRWRKTDWWLSAEESRELGFCDLVT